LEFKKGSGSGLNSLESGRTRPRIQRADPPCPLRKKGLQKAALVLPVFQNKKNSSKRCDGKEKTRFFGIGRPPSHFPILLGIAVKGEGTSKMGPLLGLL